MSGTDRQAAATPGQAAYEAFHTSIGLPITPESCGDWPGMDSFEQAHWEAAAQAALAAREPHAAGTLAAPWRQGRSQPRNVYARTGGDDWKADQLIGHFDSAGLAAGACRAHNAARETGAADGNAPELRITDCSAHGDALHIQVNTGRNWLCEVALAAILAEYEPQPAPGPAARPGEALAADNATLRDVITEVLGWFGDNGSGRYARVSGTVLARAYAKSPGIAVPEELRRYL